MKNALVGIGGVLVLLLSLLTFRDIQDNKKKALALDNKDEVFGSVDGPLPCKWEAELAERVLAENRTQALIINVTNPFDEVCTSTISLRAPGFDISPTKEDQQISLEKGTEGSLSWIISPRKTGTFDIAVSDQLNTQTFGVTVKNMLGLTAPQAKVASGFGTIFGPMLTVPWWWDRLKSRKPKPENLQGSNT